MTQPQPAATDLTTSEFDRFKKRFRGELLRPADDAYEAARRVYNAMIDRYPAVIARCADAADVSKTINFARECRLVVAVRGGGHSAAGLGTCDGGLVIDLSRMNGVRVDPNERMARVEGGCTLGEVDRATAPYGLAVPTGFISTTGVGGLTLGGGLGHLTRKYGLTIDSLLRVELVLADGSIVTASSEENGDLFWAVRGGGGNFGVATAFWFRLHPISTIYGGPMLWPLEQAEQVTRYYRDLILSATRDLSGFFMFLTVPPHPPFPEHRYLKKMCGVTWCYCGKLDGAEQVFEAIRRTVPPTLDLVGPWPYADFQSMFDGAAPPGLHQYWRADFVNELSDEAIRLHVKYAARMPTVLSTMHLYPINGAAHDISSGDTAFSFREANWAQMIIGVDPDPANSEKIIGWTKAYWLALHPYSSGGAYVNFLMDEGADRGQATYRGNYERLARVKHRYDPRNFFRLNQNIQPAM